MLTILKVGPSIIRGILLIFIFAGIVSCNLEGECSNQMNVPVIRFDMPDSIPVDSSIRIGVVYVTYSNCSRLNSLIDSHEVDTISLSVIADYIGCDCPETLPDSIVTYGFKSTVRRSFIFRAHRYDNTILQDTLKIY